MRVSPQIQIRQQYARIGIDADLGRQEIRQRPAQLTLKTEPSRLTVESKPGELTIDQTKARDALGVGSSLAFMSRVYEEARSMGLQGIAQIVERGNRMADIPNQTNAIADIAQDYSFQPYDFNYQFQAASMDNVDLSYTAHKPAIAFKPATVDIQVKVNAPEISYTRGKLDIYMQQYASVAFIPPQIDTKL